MKNDAKEDFIRTFNEDKENDWYEKYLFEDKRLGSYILAAMVGVICAFGALWTRGCYQKIRDVRGITIQDVNGDRIGDRITEEDGKYIIEIGRRTGRGIEYVAANELEGREGEIARKIQEKMNSGETR